MAQTITLVTDGKAVGCIEQYVFFRKGKDEVTLDGYFTIADLTAIIAEMQKYLPQQEA